jgi:hypothetical protein
MKFRFTSIFVDDNFSVLIAINQLNDTRGGDKKLFRERSERKFFYFVPPTVDLVGVQSSHNNVLKMNMMD